MIYGPHFNPNFRIQRVEPDGQNEDQKEGRKKRVIYQGRDWEESEEDLPLQVPQSPPPFKPRTSPTGVYADRFLLERAQKMFSQLTTLEEKIAQICFLTTEAIYDAELQQSVELIIQTWQIGGILFHKGEYRRQAFLIERFQSLSKTPLLIANDYLHGLSFYLQGGALPKDIASEQHYSDVGKAVMVQNRRLGVHIQFDRERGRKRSGMSDLQVKAFRKGVRGAQGIVGKEKMEGYENYSTTVKGVLPFVAQEGQKLFSTFSDYQVQETIGVKTLTFYDATHLNQQNLSEAFLEAFKQLYDVILLNPRLIEAIHLICALVRSGKLSEETLDRHVMKALIIKALCFK